MVSIIVFSSFLICFLNSSTLLYFSFFLTAFFLITSNRSFFISSIFFNRSASASKRCLSAYRWAMRSFLRYSCNFSSAAVRFSSSLFFRISTSVFSFSWALLSTLSNRAFCSFSLIFRYSSRSIFIEAFDLSLADILLAFWCSCITKSSIGTCVRKLKLTRACGWGVLMSDKAEAPSISAYEIDCLASRFMALARSGEAKFVRLALMPTVARGGSVSVKVPALSRSSFIDCRRGAGENTFGAGRAARILRPLF